jgi:guanosine-3',5'-bis(diphosphate) 3'-pyrophosphohydrolase
LKKTDQLIKKIKKYNPDVSIETIEAAYAFASESHKKQLRQSGEDYIEHPLQVASILADLEMDTPTIVAALLHDVPEDTDVTLDEIEEKFGKQVASMIDGVTKLSKIKTGDWEQRQAENLRKMFLATAKDVRVVLIKLADRVHNMQTIKYLPKEKAKRIARETLDIYAPLAHRLGISSIKGTLEDLSFAVLEPSKYQRIKKMVAENKDKRQRYINNAIKLMEEEIKEVGVNKARIYGRSKHFYSIYQKMARRGKDFNEIYDLSAIRVIVETVSDCYAVLGAIHNLWKPIPGRIKDYIAVPKANGYQSLHTIVIGPEGKTLEIQIRTNEMHRMDEFGVAAHWTYKEVGKSKIKNEHLLWLKQLAEWQEDSLDPKEFLESLKFDLFQNEVFIFTPKGDIVNLPAGSTPLDFAFSIHTDVGSHCVGAKVDGAIVPLEYKLQIGDRVEILTSKNASPSKDWLKMVKTPRARSKIKQWFSKEVKEDSAITGKEELLKLLRKYKVSLKVAKGKLMEGIAADYNFTTIEDLYASIGSGKTSAKQVATKLVNHLNKAEAEKKKIEEEKETIENDVTISEAKLSSGNRVGVRVRGVGDVLVRLARCCNPVPNDQIIGFVTKGRGISVHRRDCSNAAHLLREADRLIDVYWDVKKPQAFQVEIQVEAMDRVKLLRDISTIISDSGVNILSASVTTTKDGFAIFRFIFEIGNIAHLDVILKNVRKIDTVADAFRV